jgi:DoxX-like family
VIESSTGHIAFGGYVTMLRRQRRDVRPDDQPGSSDPPRNGPYFQGRRYWIRTIAFWAFTSIVTFEMAAGSLWDLLGIEYVRVIMTHLGYPLYLLTILGTWKLAGAFAIVVPRFVRLKEWVYTGFFFNYSGAAASHLLVGDGLDRWMGPLVFAVFVVASWTLRPPDRRPQNPSLAPEKRPLAWAIPIGILLLMLAISYLSVPKGPPPGY